MESTNTTKETFCIEGGRKNFYQWDIDQKIIVNDPDIDEVHFCNGTSDKALVSVVKDWAASVPNILLQTAGKVKAYGYSVDHTRVEKIYEVKARTKPDDYVYEETEVLRWAELDKRIVILEEAAIPGEWHTFRTETITPFVSSTVNIFTENEKKYSKYRVEIEYSGDKEGAIDVALGTYEEGVWINQTVAKVKVRFTPEKKYAAMELYPDKGYWDMTLYGAAENDEAPPVFGMPKQYAVKNKLTDIPQIEAVKLECDKNSGISTIPKGTIITIKGMGKQR